VICSQRNFKQNCLFGFLFGPEAFQAIASLFEEMQSQPCQVQFAQTLPGYLLRPSMTPWEREPHGALLEYSQWSGGKGGAEVFCFLLV
jgi:hypothetical protein